MKGELFMTRLVKNTFRGMFFAAIVTICMLNFGVKEVHADVANNSDSKIEQAQSNITKISIKQYEKNIRRTKTITVDQFLKLVKKQGKGFYLFFGFKECPYCRRFSPTLKLFSTQKGVRPIYYVNVDTFGVNDNKNSDSYKYVRTFIGTKIKLKSTPTIAAVKDGHVIGQYNDSKTTLHQLEKLQKKLVISKN